MSCSLVSSLQNSICNFTVGRWNQKLYGYCTEWKNLVETWPPPTEKWFGTESLLLLNTKPKLLALMQWNQILISCTKLTFPDCSANECLQIQCSRCLPLFVCPGDCIKTFNQILKWKWELYLKWVVPRLLFAENPNGSFFTRPAERS